MQTLALVYKAAFTFASPVYILFYYTPLPAPPTPANRLSRAGLLTAQPMPCPFPSLVMLAPTQILRLRELCLGATSSSKLLCIFSFPQLILTSLFPAFLGCKHCSSNFKSGIFCGILFLIIVIWKAGSESLTGSTHF